MIKETKVKRRVYKKYPGPKLRLNQKQHEKLLAMIKSEKYANKDIAKYFKISLPTFYNYRIRKIRKEYL